jgi:hypothetical protein
VEETPQNETNRRPIRDFLKRDLRPPRFRLRTLLVVVVVMAAALGAWRLLGRVRYCLGHARSHRALSLQNQAFARDMEIVAEFFRRDLARLKADPDCVLVVELRRPPRDAEDKVRLLEVGVANATRKAGSYRAESERERRIAQNYERVLRYPWLPVPPDPPVPKLEPE